MPDEKIVSYGGWSGDAGFVPGGKSTNKYDPGIMFDDNANRMRIRADRQPFMQQLGNSMQQMFATLVGQTIESVGAITDSVANLLGADIDPDGGLTGFGKGIIDRTNEQAPIYWDKESQGFLSSGYILSRLPSVVSTAAMLVPGMGVAKGVGWLARAAKLGTMIEKIGATVLGGVAMRHAENKMEAAQTYSELMQDFANGTNSTGANPDYKVLNEKDAAAAAREGANLTYMADWSNVFFDIAQLAMVLKPFSGLFTKTLGDNALTSTLDYGYSVTKKRGLLGFAAEGADDALGVAIPQAGKFKRALLKGTDVFKPLAYQLNEGIEEGVNFIAQQEGIRRGGIEAGTLKDDGTTFSDRLGGKYMKDWQLYDSMAWGVLGGIMFQAGGAKLSSTMDKLAIRKQIAELSKTPGNEAAIEKLKADLKNHGWWNNVLESSDRLASLKQREEDIAEYVAVVKDAASTVQDKEIAKRKMIFNLVAAGHTTNTVDLLLADLKNPKTSGIIAQQLGLSQEDAATQIPMFIREAEYIKNQIDRYQGGSFSSLWGARNPENKTDVELDIPGAVTEPASRKESQFESESRRVGNFADPRMAVQLAFNDYKIRVLDEMNQNMLKDISTEQNKLFSGTLAFSLPGQASMGNVPMGNVSPNAQQYLSLKSDIAALEAVKKGLEDQAKVYEEIKVTERTTATQKRLMEEVDNLMKAKTKKLDEVAGIIKENLKDPVTKETETSMEALDKLTSQFSGHNNTVISDKMVYFQNQVKKQEMIDLSNQIITDPLKYQRETIEDMRKFNDYLAAKEKAKEAKTEADKVINTEIARLEDINDPEFAKQYKTWTDHFVDELNKLDTKEQKAQLLLKFANTWDAKHAKDTKDGKFKRATLDEFYTEFDRDLYRSNKAAMLAIKDLRKNPEYMATPASGKSSKKSSVGSTINTDTAEGKALNEVRTGIDQFMSLFSNTSPLASNRAFTRIDNMPAEAEQLRGDIAAINDLLKKNQEDKADASVRIENNRRIDAILDKYKDYKISQFSSLIREDKVDMLMGILEETEKMIPELANPIVNSPILFDIPILFRLEIQGMGENEEAKNVYTPTQNAFSEYFYNNIASSYPTFQALIDDIENLKNVFAKKLQDMEKAYVAATKGEVRPAANSKPVLDDTDAMELEMDTFGDADSLIHKENILNPALRDAASEKTQGALTRQHAGTNEQLTQETMPHLMVLQQGDLVMKTDVNGMAVPNEGYPFWDAHQINGNGETSAGFVHQGSILVLKKRKVKGRDNKEYENVEVYNNGVHVTNLDSVDRLDKTLNTLKTAQAAAKTESERTGLSLKINSVQERRERILAINKTLNDLGGGPVYIELMNQLAVGNSESSADTSGGLYLGRVYTIARDPKTGVAAGIGVKTAFGNNVNTKGNPIMAIHWNGAYFVEKDGERVEIGQWDENIHIPESLKVVHTTSTAFNKEYNGLPVVLVPTHTTTGNGKHIYMPYKMYNLPLNDRRLTSDGTDTGTTMGERMFEALMDPDGHRDEFIQLLKVVGLDKKFNPALSINDPKNKGIASAFYTTSNLLTVFNKVLFMFDMWDTKKTKRRDYSKHIGINVVTSKKDGKRYIQFFTTSTEVNTDNADLNVHNYVSYAIPVLTKDGEFAPVVFNTKRKLVTDDEKADPDFKGFEELAGSSYRSVDPIAQIKARLRQKLFRADMMQLSKSTNAGSYVGFVFNQKTKKLEARTFKSYVDYLEEVKPVTTTVYGIPVKTRDGKSNRSFFYNRQIFLNPASMRKAEQGAERKSTVSPRLSKKGNKKKADGPKKSMVTRKKTGPGPVILNVEVPLNLRESIDMRNAGKIKLSPDKKQWMIDGVPHERLHAFLPNLFPKKSNAQQTDTLATATGNVVDRFAKDFFEGTLSPQGAAFYNMSTEAYNSYIKAFNQVKAKGEMVVGVGVVLFGELANGKKVAGEADMITINAAGKLTIYDFKTSGSVFAMEEYDNVIKKNGLELSNKDLHSLQLSGYSVLNELMGGGHFDNYRILPSTVASESMTSVEKGNHAFIHSVIPYDEIPLSFNPDIYKYMQIEPEAETAKSQNIDENDIVDDDNDEYGTYTPEDKPSSMSTILETFDGMTPEEMAKPENKQFFDIMMDPSKMLHKGETLQFQNEAVDLVADTITNILYQHRVVNGKRSGINQKKLLEMVTERLNKIQDDFRKLAKSGRKRVMGNIVELTDAQMAAYEKQASELERVIPFMDWETMLPGNRFISDDFIGYYRMALDILKSNQLVDINLFKSNEDNSSRITEVSNSTRFGSNYSVRMNPKTTITAETKIILSQLRELDRIENDGKVGFKEVKNIFGLPKYYPLENIIHEFFIEFDGINPSRVLSHLEAIKDKTPYVKSFFDAIERMSRVNNNPAAANAKRKRFMNMLSSFVKQHRQMRALNISVGFEEGRDGKTNKPTAVLFNSFRQGVTKQIMNVWGDLFNKNFTSLFDITKVDDPLEPDGYKLDIKAKQHKVMYDSDSKSIPNFEFKLESNSSRFSIFRQIYEQLEKQLATGKVRISFSFDKNGLLKFGDEVTTLTANDAFHIVSLFDLNKVVFAPEMKSEIDRLRTKESEGKKHRRVFEDTVLEQIVNNLEYFLDRRGLLFGAEESNKDYKQYDPVMYRFMATQMERLGIQLAEDKEYSWKVLADLNTPTEVGSSYYKYQNYDRTQTSFKGFMLDKINTLIVERLMAPGAFNPVLHNSADSEFATNEVAEFKIDEPLEKAAKGLEPFALHARSEWVKLSNNVIRNVEGNLEYVNVPHNTLSLLMNELHDNDSAENGYLSEIANTPFALHNYFIKRLVSGDKDAASLLNLFYIDGAIVNKYLKKTPNASTIGLNAMIEFNAYFNGERKSKGRGTGLYIMTYSDSTVMPAIQFEKNKIPLVFNKTWRNGVMDFEIGLSEFLEDGSLNPVYEKLYSVYRAELERIAQGFRIWEEISQLPEQERDAYVIEQDYRENVHFVRNKQGSISGPGSATKFYIFGNTFFDAGSRRLGIYNADGTALKDELYLNGSIVEGNARSAFANVVNLFLNEMVDDAYDAFVEMEDGFYQVEDNGTTLSVKYPFLDESAVNYITGTLFNQMVRIGQYGDEGPILVPPTTDIISDTLTKRYTKAFMDKPDNLEFIIKTVDPDAIVDNLTDAEVDNMKVEFLKIMGERREEDKKTSRLAFAKMKYMIAERAINEFLMRTTMNQLTFDMASIGKSGAFSSQFGVYMKRMMAMLAPGDGHINERYSSPATVIGYQDDILGDMKRVYTEEEINADPQTAEFVKAFRKAFANDPRLIDADGKMPMRLLDIAFVYNTAREEDRESVLQDIGNKLRKTETTNAAGYMTARESFYRMLQQGLIDELDYKRLVDHAYGSGLTQSDIEGLSIKINKYVYAGPNVNMNDTNRSMLMNYIKFAELPLIKNLTVFPGTPLDAIREQLESREREVYAGEGDIHPGMMLVPPSAHKVGFSSTAKLYNADGSVTGDIATAQVLKLDRSYLRQQVLPSSKDLKDARLSTQSNKQMHNNIPHYWRFGQNSFRVGKVSSDVLTPREQRDLENMDGAFDEGISKNGISNNQFEVIKYRVFSELAVREANRLAAAMGFSMDQETMDMTITNIDKFLKGIAQHAINQYGISSNSLGYLSLNSTGTKMNFPITFSPNNRSFQSVLLSQLEKIFYGMRLPGGTYASTPATGLIKDHSLKSPRIRQERKLYSSEEAAYADFSTDDMIGGKPVKIDDTHWEVNYRVVDPGEVAMIWNFKDEDGKPLDYTKYVNPDGTPKSEMFDNDVLTVVVNRIPNTGPNTSAVLKVAKFFPPGVKDAIAMSPELVEVWNADHDYDKLFTYTYNYSVEDNGKVSKIRSVVHYTQVDAQDEFASDKSFTEYVRRRLLEDDPEYQAIMEELRDQDDVLEVEELNPNNQMAVELAKLHKEKANARIKELRDKEADAWARYRDEYENSSIYGRQSSQQLQNVLIDIQRTILSDYKMMRAGARFLTSDFVHDQLDRKIAVTPRYGEVSETRSLGSLFDSAEYKNPGSFWTYSKLRAISSTADRMVGIAANMMSVAYLAQRFGLSYNAWWAMFTPNMESWSNVKVRRKTGFEEDADPEAFPEHGFYILFKDNAGYIKGEDSFASDNIPYRHPRSQVAPDGTVINQQMAYAGFTFHKMTSPVVSDNGNTGQIYRYPEMGRYRYDRIYTVLNNGKRVNVTVALESLLQAFLDNMNKPVQGYQNLNPETSNAWLQLTLLGYLDEAPLLMMQESVVRFVESMQSNTRVDPDDFRSRTASGVAAIASILDMDLGEVWSAYNSIPGTRRHLVTLLNDLIKERMDTADFNPEALALSEKELADMLAYHPRIDSSYRNDGFGQEVPEFYKIGQLKALRTFLLADQYGRDLYKVHQNTNTDSQGLRNSLVEVKMQREGFVNLFNMHKVGRGKGRWKFSTSAPSVAGLHRMNYQWAYQMQMGHGDNATATWRPSHVSFGQKYGLSPIMSLLQSAKENNIFYEYSGLFTKAFYDVMQVAGKDSRRLSMSDKVRMVNKVNVNFISYILSNPELFRGMFKNSEEFDFFTEYGKRIQALPDSSLPVREEYEIFNNVESVAALLERMADPSNKDMEDPEKRSFRYQFEILDALRPILNNDDKRPSTVVMPGSAKMDNIGNRIAISLMSMLSPDNKNNETKILAKRIILFAYQMGGVTTPNSFIQHIPPYILMQYGFHNELRGVLKSLEDNSAFGTDNTWVDTITKSFAIQFIQHNPFELERTVSTDALRYHEITNEEGEADSVDIAYSEEYKRDFIELDPGAPGFKKRPVSKDVVLIGYKDRLWMRVRGSNHFAEVDRAGLSKYHRNEYTWPNEAGVFTETETLYANNRSKRKGSFFAGRPEVKGILGFDPEMGDYSEEEIIEFQEKAERVVSPLHDKVVAMVSEGSALAGELAADLMFDDINSDASAILGSVMPILDNAGMEVTFVTENTNPNRMWYNPAVGSKPGFITINAGHPDYNGLLSSDPNLFDKELFAKDYAHEVSHAITKEGINKVLGLTGTAAGIKSSKDALSRKNPELVQAVDRLIELQRLVRKRLEFDKALGEDHTNYKRYVAITEKLNAAERNGKKDSTITPADLAFWREHHYFRALLDLERNATVPNNQIHEFVAYAYSDSNFQRILNSISFKDEKKNKTFWEKVKEVLLDILSFFGLDVMTDEQINKNLETIKKGVSKKAVYSYMKLDKTGRPEGQVIVKGKGVEAVNSLIPYSALQVSMNNILTIRNYASSSAQMLNTKTLAADLAGSSSMSSLILSEKELNEMYSGVRNFDTRWTYSVKQAYHNQVMNNKILC